MTDFTAFKYYAEPIGGTDRWRIVRKNSETGHCLIIGSNLRREFAEELADKLQTASDIRKSRLSEDDIKKS